jgi:hypothetical protein
VYRKSVTGHQGEKHADVEQYLTPTEFLVRCDDQQQDLR